MNLNIHKLLKSDKSAIVISIVLGLGLAALFRKVCEGSKCIIVEGPALNETESFYYKIDKDCYKYTPVATECIDWRTDFVRVNVTLINVLIL